MPASEQRTRIAAAAPTASDPRAAGTVVPARQAFGRRRRKSAETTRRRLVRPLSRATATIRAASRTTVFFLKVLPMLPSGALDRVTPRPVVERLTYPTRQGQATGDLYRPSTPGPHPALVVCLGVVPFEVDHPQVPRLGEALARAGFAALLYWSPAMRDLRLDEEDIADIALAYDRLLELPYVDASRSGLLGTCVGGSFALMAAAHPLIRDRLGFVAAFAPYASMASLAVAIASSTRSTSNGRKPWPVDQLTRRVYIRSFTAELEPDEAEELRDGLTAEGGLAEQDRLSATARLILPLLGAIQPAEAQAALGRLPAAMRERLERLSPLTYLDDIRTPRIIFGHDRDDMVIPVGESRQLAAALAGRAGVRYTEFGMFQHADPTKKKLPLPRLLHELGKFYLYAYPLFRQAV